MKRRSLVLAIFFVAGCMDSLQNQTKSTGSTVLGQSTSKIEEFDPNKKDQKISDSKIEITNPVTGGLEAYGPALERISKDTIHHALDLYKAEKGDYPKTHEEFMTEIIKENNVRLPVLPGNKAYQYDVANHKLVVVEKTGN